MNQSDVLEICSLESWQGPVAADTQQRAVAALESGKVISFPRLPFILEPSETKYLDAAGSGIKGKNVSFDWKSGKISNVELEQDDLKRLGSMLDRFGSNAHKLLQELLPEYASQLARGRTSYRPIEIKGRTTTPRKDDTRLHVDSFPSRPVRGKRILRIFSNVAGDGADRHWQVGEPFNEFAQKFAPRLKPPVPGSLWLLERLGITKERRSTYDHYMLSLHDQMKLDANYQSSAFRADVHFSAGSTWLCFTDQVLHAALAGHAALEQTFLLPVEAMATPEKAPLRVLEGLTGKALV